MRQAVWAMGAVLAMVGAAGCAREGAPPATGRAELAFAYAEGAGTGCVQAGPSHVSAVHPPVLERLREGAAPGKRFSTRIDEHRTVAAWLEGTVEEGYRVHVVALGANGEELGPVVEIADDHGGVVGRPELSFAPDGTSGEVTYLASTEDEFRLVATPLRCTFRP
jgi:hypothetical protein